MGFEFPIIHILSLTVSPGSPRGPQPFGTFSGVTSNPPPCLHTMERLEEGTDHIILVGSRFHKPRNLFSMFVLGDHKTSSFPLTSPPAFFQKSLYRSLKTVQSPILSKGVSPILSTLLSQSCVVVKHISPGETIPKAVEAVEVLGPISQINPGWVLSRNSKDTWPMSEGNPSHINTMYSKATFPNKTFQREGRHNPFMFGWQTDYL